MKTLTMSNPGSREQQKKTLVYYCKCELIVFYLIILLQRNISKLFKLYNTLYHIIGTSSVKVIQYFTLLKSATRCYLTPECVGARIRSCPHCGY